MCGIVGMLDYLGEGHRVDPVVFDELVDSISHRGPDGRGVWHRPGIALGNRRLAIQDPTDTGAQPMHYANGRLTVTYNGEIYNFRELRRELAALGHEFASGCDTEVLLAPYAQWGTDAVRRWNGIFGFALWDEDRRRLWLGRDRLGVKPLFYSTRGGVLRFGSEAKTILKDPDFSRAPCAFGLNALLTFGYVPAPWTGFDGLEQLPPGHDAVVENGRIEVRRYWAPPTEIRSASREENYEAFSQLFAEAVQREMVSDVPVGAFLSGGVDSAAVASKAAAVTPGLRTFSLGFATDTFDETPDAEKTATLIGTDHQSKREPLDLATILPKVIDFCEEPFADSSTLAVYQLCEMASQQVKVALSGDGADELLAGYPTYYATKLASHYRRLPSWSRALIRGAALRLPVSDSRYSLHQFASRFVLGAEEGPGRDFASWRIHFRGEERRAVLKPDFWSERDPLDVYAGESAANGLKGQLLADLQFYLPNDMLVKVDRMSMAHGLEVRVPFLNHELVEFCATLPPEHLTDGSWRGRNKLPLRYMIARDIAPEVAERKKTGFNVPVERAFRHELRPMLLDAVRAKRFSEDGPIDVSALEALAERHRRKERDYGHALFTALVLALWWDRWL